MGQKLKISIQCCKRNKCTVFTCVHVLELFHELQQQTAAAGHNHLSAKEQPGRPPSNWEGFTGIKLCEGVRTLTLTLNQTYSKEEEEKRTPAKQLGWRKRISLLSPLKCSISANHICFINLMSHQEGSVRQYKVTLGTFCVCVRAVLRVQSPIVV